MRGFINFLEKKDRTQWLYSIVYKEKNMSKLTQAMITGVDEVMEATKIDKFLSLFTVITTIFVSITFESYSAERALMSGLWLLLTGTGYAFKMWEARNIKILEYNAEQRDFVKEAYGKHMRVKHEILVDDSDQYHKRLIGAVNRLVQYVSTHDIKTEAGSTQVNLIVKDLIDTLHAFIDLKNRIYQPYKQVIEEATTDNIPKAVSNEIEDVLEHVKKSISSVADAIEISTVDTSPDTDVIPDGSV